MGSFDWLRVVTSLILRVVSCPSTTVVCDLGPRPKLAMIVGACTKVGSISWQQGFVDALGGVVFSCVASTGNIGVQLLPLGVVLKINYCYPNPTASHTLPDLRDQGEDKPKTG